MTSSAPESREAPVVDSPPQSGMSVSINRYVKIHVLFAVAFLISLAVSITTLQLVNSADINWLYATDPGYRLLVLFLIVVPLMAVMFANMKKVRGHLGTSTVERNPLLLAVVLILLALVLLVPVAWSVRYFFYSFTVMSAIAAGVVLWLAVYAYLVIAGAIHSANPLRFMKRCCRQHQLWLVFVSMGILISAFLVPLIAGIMASEAWQYYPVEELVILRLPAVLMFGLPSALLIPLLPLTLESVAAEREVRWTWD